MHYKKAIVVLSGAMQNFANTEKKKGALKVYILSAPTPYSAMLGQLLKYLNHKNYNSFFYIFSHMVSNRENWHSLIKV